MSARSARSLSVSAGSDEVSLRQVDALARAQRAAHANAARSGGRVARRWRPARSFRPRRRPDRPRAPGRTATDRRRGMPPAPSVTVSPAGDLDVVAQLAQAQLRAAEVRQHRDVGPVRARAAHLRGLLARRRVRQVHAQHVDAGVEQPLERARGQPAPVRSWRRSSSDARARTPLYAGAVGEKIAIRRDGRVLTEGLEDRHLAETWTSLRSSDREHREPPPVQT